MNEVTNPTLQQSYYPTQSQAQLQKDHTVTNELEDLSTLRDSIADRYNVATEDAQVLMTGIDEVTLLKQARRLTEIHNPTRKKA